MNKTEIEHFVSSYLRQKMPDLISECMSELDKQGHSFHPQDELLIDWREDNSDKLITIIWSNSVHCTEEAEPKQSDPVADSFIARAESGKDKEATLLNLLEGDINNGGFFQLFDNKGIEFMKDGALLLRKIGSKTTLRILNEAIAVFESNEQMLADYGRLRKTLLRLDKKFYSLKESIAVLFEQYRNQHHA
jgi:hypothetical protein